MNFNEFLENKDIKTPQHFGKSNVIKKYDDIIFEYFLR